MDNKGKGLLLSELSKFRQKVSGVKKSGYNDFTKSKYSTLDDVVEAITSGCKDLHLGYYHTVDGLRVSTFLTYSDGENFFEIESSLPVNVTGSKNEMQAMGAVITYAKRYTLQSLFGLPSEDDDGNSAKGVKVQAPPVKVKPQPQKYTLEMLEKHREYIEGKYFKGSKRKYYDPVIISQVIVEDLKLKPFLVNDVDVLEAIGLLCDTLSEKYNTPIDDVLDDSIPL